MSAETASREVLWNISHYYLMYPALLVALVFFGIGLWRRLNYWRQGKSDPTIKPPWPPRLLRSFLDTILQRRVLESIVPGLFHISIFWSFIILLVATTVVGIDMYLPWKIFQGRFYLWISLLADLAGLFFTLGLGVAFVRRYLLRPAKLKSSWQDALIHGAFFYLMLSGFLLEAIRIRYAGDPWAAWTPFGYAMSFLFVAVPENLGRFIHVSNWWLHALVTFGLIALIPYTKLLHLITIPVNSALNSNRRRGELARPDLAKLMESDVDFHIGMSTLQESSWKMRLDHDACIECGRCDDHCPAQVTGHNLSPMNIILGLRDLGREATTNKGDLEALEKEIVGDRIEAISLWECRTCYACVEVCPAGIDQLSQIVEMRRSEVLMKGELPAEAQQMLRDLETRGNPFGSQEDRLAWIRRQGFRLLEPGEKVEVLYWIGCATSFDPRKQKVAHDLVRIMEAAGVSYAVLGDKEGCTGDPARVLGDENIFQSMAKSQLEQINPEQFDTMVVNCPHCYNAFDNEYRQFGANFKVIHHSEFIRNLVRDGRLKLSATHKRKLAFHDPCYLGRVQGVYDPPRELLTMVAGKKPLELSRNRKKSGCCGAGGGHFWMDLKAAGERLDNRRIDEVAAVGAETLGVGCVFCMQMLENGLKARDLESKVQVRDLAELVAESLEQAG